MPGIPAGSLDLHSSRMADDLTIRAFQDLIRQRYYATDSARGSAATFLWFSEEVGELAHALGEKHRGREDRANLEEEFADVLAWLCTLANINDIDLAEALSKYTVGGGPQGTKS